MRTKGNWDAQLTPFGFCILAGSAVKAVAERYFNYKPTKAELNELHANAHLISASPDLLEACEEAAHLITNHTDGQHRAFIECENDLLRAVAKAKGGEK